MALIITYNHGASFSPCSRYCIIEILESQDGLVARFRDPNLELLRERNLNVSTEEFLSAERAFTFADLYAMLGNEDTVVWLTPHAAVVRNHGKAEDACNYIDEPCRFCCSASTNSPEPVIEICDVVLRLLAVSVVHSVNIDDWICLGGELINVGVSDGALPKSEGFNIEGSKD
jgi:hypothetical protein